MTICSEFVAQKNKVWHCFHCFPIYFPWSDGTRCHDLRFLNVELEANFFTLHFPFIKRLLSSSSLSAIRVVSSAYLRLLIFLLAILISACASSSPAFLMMYSTHKLNKQSDSIQPWRFSYLEPVCCSMPSSNCCFLTCIQVSQEAGKVVWYSHLFQNFPVSRNWWNFCQEIQARLYWRLCCSTGEQEKNNRFACLLPAPWGGLAPNIGPVVCAGVRLEAWLAHAFRWYVVPCFCSWFFRPGSCIFVSFVQKLL